MKLFISTSIVTLLAISAAAGVMPDEIPSTANIISETVEMASAADASDLQIETSLKEKLNEFFRFAVTALIVLL